MRETIEKLEKAKRLLEALTETLRANYPTYAPPYDDVLRIGVKYGLVGLGSEISSIGEELPTDGFGDEALGIKDAGRAKSFRDIVLDYEERIGKRIG